MIKWDWIAKFNDIDREAWLCHVLVHISEHPVNQIDVI